MVPRKLLWLQNEVQAKAGNIILTSRRTTNGLKQGHGLSLRFKIYLESVLYTWKKRCKNMGLPTGDLTIHHLFCR
jgi:hypothetical protein